MIKCKQGLLPDGRDVVAICANPTVVFNELVAAILQGIDAYTLATDELCIGVSTGVAVYAYTRIVVESFTMISTVCPNTVDAKIDLHETRFCHVIFNTGEEYYSFGNIGDKDPIIVHADDVTQSMRSLIGQKLKNVVLRSYYGHIRLEHWEPRV